MFKEWLKKNHEKNVVRNRTVIQNGLRNSKKSFARSFVRRFHSPSAEYVFEVLSDPLNAPSKRIKRRLLKASEFQKNNRIQNDYP